MAAKTKNTVGNSVDNHLDPWCAEPVTIGQDPYRLTVPRRLRKVAPWLAKAAREKKNRDCILVRGTFGGLQVDPIDGQLAEIQNDLRENQPYNSDESNSACLELIRFFARSWPVELQVQGEHFRFVMPKTIPSDILPLTKGSELIFFAAGNVVEIWERSAFDRHVLTVAENRSEIYKKVHEEARKKSGKNQ